MLFYVIIAIMAVYLLLTLFFTYLVHQIPRAPLKEPPDWGQVTDTRIPAADGGELEVWRVEPEGESKGVVLLAHGRSSRHHTNFREPPLGKNGMIR